MENFAAWYIFTDIIWPSELSSENFPSRTTIFLFLFVQRYVSSMLYYYLKEVIELFQNHFEVILHP